MTATLTLIALLCLAALAGQARSHRPNLHPAGTLATPRIHELYWLRGQLNHALSARCLPARTYRWRPAYRVPAGARTYVIQQTRGWLQQARSRTADCELARATAWHYSAAASCVRSKEGGLTSVNPAGPYYGWYQTDPSFQAAYGPEFVRAYGHGIWPARAQILTAYRGWRARGWYPWPNTARACGLI